MKRESPRTTTDSVHPMYITNPHTGTEIPDRRPVTGELVTVGDLPQTFRVIDFDGATFVLESEHGARCKAGVLVVRLAETKRDAAA